MTTVVPEYILEARRYLVEGRDRVRDRHRSNPSGRIIASALTELIDNLITRLVWHAATDLSDADTDRFEAHMALVAVGGYGRGELAPYSDVDLLFLCDGNFAELAGEMVNRLVRDLWDVKLKLGSSMRTLKECIQLARQDLTIHTALLEARHVTGNPWLTETLKREVCALTEGRRCDPFLENVFRQRFEEQGRYGQTVHLLEPDVKKSRGGLREYHLFRWIALARCGTARLSVLVRENWITQQESEQIQEARKFLLRARNDLHFEAGRARDRLTLDQQIRLAKVWGFKDSPGKRAVQQFMQEYYHHSEKLDELTSRFFQRGRSQSWTAQLLGLFTGRKIGDYLVSGKEVALKPHALSEAEQSLERIVAIVEFSKGRQAMIAPVQYDRLLHAVATLPDDSLQAARSAFLRLLETPGNLFQTLTELLSLGMLERLLPEFTHVRGLIQFNQVHKYTVDEHLLRCIANAENLAERSSVLGYAYREIHDKGLLHFALLLHDLGKGFEQDHSVVGQEIAQRAAERFGLGAHRRELLLFLVREHLTMSDLAFKRDTTDEKVLGRFVRGVGTPEVLKMLFVLTACDITSVGPDTWTSWKEEVLTDLYRRAMEWLSGNLPPLRPEDAVAQIRTATMTRLAGSIPQAWLERQLESLTTQYVLSYAPDQIAEHFRTIFRLPPGEVICVPRYLSHTGITEYTVITRDSITRGLFSKIAGVLAAKGLQILGAQISTHNDGVVVDRFEVFDIDFQGPPPEQRTQDVSGTIRQALLDQVRVEDLFKSSRRADPRYSSLPDALREPTDVRIDNDTSDQYTIIDVFANDRQGLLYVITHAMMEMELSIALAKIVTSQDQVMDVFYVSDMQGRKITDGDWSGTIRERLIEAIEQFDDHVDLPGQEPKTPV